VRLRWTDVTSPGTPLKISADPSARAAIAEHLGAEAVAFLEAALSLSPWLDGVEVAGSVRASVTRLCGVTLDPFDEMIDEQMLLRVVPRGSPNAQEPHGEVELDLEADDPPDIVDTDTIDLAAYVVEQLALALSPFPRRPDAVFEPPSQGGVISPFAALARLKPGSKEE
jgi:uncharacterized metal-binding protein YceD (DUF177 family)